jgi:hypothetical protein
MLLQSNVELIKRRSNSALNTALVLRAVDKNSNPEVPLL